MTPTSWKVSVLVWGTAISGCWQHYDGNVKAETTTIVLLIAAVALSALAYALQPKPKNELRIDNQQTTLTTRGSYAQLVIGRRPVAPVFVWAGDRKTKEESVGGKGGGGGGTSITYTESGVHLIGTGPGKTLYGIYKRGVKLWEGPITRFDTPSGSTVDTPDGSFRIYWGEENQPVDSYLADDARLGVPSNWPFHWFVVWIDHALGASPRWDQIEYDAGAEAVGSRLRDSVAVLPETDAALRDSGVNAAHAIYQIVTGTYPHGAGCPDAMDFGALEQFGELIEDEHLPVSILAKDGRTAAGMIAALAQELGFMLPQVGRKLVVVPIRPETDSPEFTADTVVGPDPEQEFQQADETTTAVTYLFPDAVKRYKTNDVAFDDDAAARELGVRGNEDASFECVTDKKTAFRRASSRQAETLAGKTRFKLDMGFTARVLYPGKAFRTETHGRLRVVSKIANTGIGTVQINAVRDQYSELVTETSPGGPGGPTGGTAAADAIVNVIELPYSAVGEDERVGVLRARGSERSGPAVVHASADGTSYRAIGTQANWAKVGYLNEPLREDGPTVDWSGPQAIPHNDDWISAADLSSDDSSWLSGVQLAVVGDEICFVKKLTPSGTVFRLAGLVRGRAGTMARNWPSGTPIFVILRDQLRPLGSLIVSPNATVSFKSQPAGVQIAAVTPVTKRLLGPAFAPPPVDNIVAVQGQFEYTAVSIVDSDETGRWVEIAGAGTVRLPFHRGATVALAGGTADGYYTIEKNTQSGGNTRIYFEETPTGITTAGTIAVARRETRYQSADLEIEWSYRSRISRGLGAGDGGFGAAVQTDADGQARTLEPEGEFYVEVFARGSTTPVRTYTTTRRRVAYSSAQRTADFGSEPPSFDVAITNRNGAYAAWTRRVTLTRTS